MREIKFRAWDKVEKKFAFYELINGEINWLSDFLSLDANRGEDMQFIGLLDKNGKEIYENDIVNIKHPEDVGGDFGDTNGRVFWWDEEGAWYHWNQSGRPPKKMWKYCEIIGNIYENPELLK